MEIAVPQSNSILMSMPATRFSGIGRWAALAVIGVTLLASAVFILLAMSYQPPDKAPTASRGDLAVYDRIIDRMHHGEGYYPAAHAELLAGHYGTLSVFNWRLPLLSLIVNVFPATIWAEIAAGFVAIAALLLAFTLFRRMGNAGAAYLVAPILAASLAACATPAAVTFSDIITGVFILLSAMAYGLRLPVLGFAAAVLALFMRELAAPYVLVCIWLAFRQGRGIELWAWCAALLGFAGYFLWHALSVQAQLGPQDIGYPDDWVQFGGFGFVLATASFNGLLIGQPLWITAILLPFALLGLIAWRGPAASRVQATVAAYILLFLVVGKPFNDYWGGLYTPLLMLGVPLLPVALRDLVLSLRGHEGGQRRSQP